MDKCKINIAVIEPSQIVYEGIYSVLMKCQKNYFVSRANDLRELADNYTKTKYNVAIVNPSVIQNKINVFLKLKKELQEISWIGLLYSFFDKMLFDYFDETFSITDSIESISHKISRNCVFCNCREQSCKELTAREIEILLFLTRGLTNKEIADKLNISIHTVITHRKKLCEKTSIKSLPGLTIYAISKKLISVDPLDY